MPFSIGRSPQAPDQIAGAYTSDETSCLSDVCTEVDADGIPDGCQIDEPCVGDVNADEFVDGVDLAFILGTWGSDDVNADVSGDGTVDGADLALVLGAWGVCETPADCIGDINGSGAVDGQDLAILLGAWGACP